MRRAKPKSELTREKFSFFLEWLSPDPERAGEEYQRLRFRLFLYFSDRQCTDADELTDETIERVVRKVSEETIEHKIAYCYGIAKNVYREWLRRPRPPVPIAGERDLAEVLREREPVEDPWDLDFLECLEKCLQELPPESRTLLLVYFSEEKSAKIDLHQRLAKSLKMTQTALRMRVMRLKGKVKLCIEQGMNTKGVTEAS